MIKKIVFDTTKDLSLFEFKKYEILYKDIIVENHYKEFPKYDFWLVSRSISHDIEFLKNFWLYIRVGFVKNSKAFKYKLFFNNIEIEFLKNGEILNNPTNLNDNIFKWTEENFFYVRLKY